MVETFRKVEDSTIPTDATLTQLSDLLAKFGNSAAYAEREMRHCEASMFHAKHRYEQAMLLVTSQIEAKTETAKRAQALTDNEVRRLSDLAAELERRYIESKGDRDYFRMLFDATSRIVAVRQMEHDIDVRLR